MKMKQAVKDNKSLNKPFKRFSEHLNTHQLVISVFYSIRLREFNNIYNHKFGSVVSTRIAYVILNHLNSYQRTIKQDFVRLYNLRLLTLTPILEQFVKCGFLIEVNSKGKSNLGLYVYRKSYQITSAGKSVVYKINELIASKIENLN